MARVTLDSLRKGEAAEAAYVLSQGMRTNPIHVAVLGDQAERQRRQLEGMFRMVLQHAMDEVTVAREDGRIVAVAGATQWPHCRPSLLRGLRLLPGMVMTLRGTIPRVVQWESTWQRYNPREPHSHLGPIAVLPELQGQGIGSRLLEAYCQRLDEAHEASYLETDKDVNVRLYARFGYQVTAEVEVLRTRNWFMWRPAR